MGWLREVFGLFVDDGAFAAAILAWLAITWLLTWLGALGPAWGGFAFFAGLAAMLVVSAVQRAKRR